MKNLMMLILSGVFVIVLSGCGGGGGSEDPTYDTYFITDSYGDGVEGIIYYCDSGIQGITDFYGAFDFDIYGDTCDFDLDTNSIVGDLYLESDSDPMTDAGINDIDFDCEDYNFNILSNVTRYDSVLDLHGYIEDVSSYAECTLYNL